MPIGHTSNVLSPCVFIFDVKPEKLADINPGMHDMNWIYSDIDIPVARLSFLCVLGETD